MEWLRTVAVVGAASWTDMVRRPTTWVGTLSLAGVLGVIPHLGNPAAGIADNAALAVELTIATWMAVVPFTAGALAVRGMDRGAGFGLGPEILVTPVSLPAVVVARWVGAVAVSLGVGAVALLLASVGWWGTSFVHLPVAAAPWAGLGVGAVLASALAAALGLFYRAFAPRDLALVLLAAHLVGARALAAGVADAGWTRWLPDAQRLDVAREFAFGHAVAASWIAWGALALVLQIVALCAAAAVGSQRAARSGTP